MIATALLTVGCGNRTTDDNMRQQNFDGSLDRTLNQPENGMMDNGLIYNDMNQRRFNTNDNHANRARNDNRSSASEVDIAEEAAQRVTELNFVRSAYVLKTSDNAFVAAVLKDGGDLSKQMEDQIAQKVRSVDSSVKNVYVSTNPNFIDRVDRYIDDIRAGRPVEGFFEEFSEMVDRMFPNAR